MRIFVRLLDKRGKFYVSGKGIDHLIMIIVRIFKNNDETKCNVCHYKII